MQVFSIDDQYVVHDYDVMCNDVHIVYLRNLGKYSQGKISDDLDDQIKISIEKEFPNAVQSVSKIITDDDLKTWDENLLKYKQLTANYRYSFGNPMIYLIGVVCYASILVPKGEPLDDYNNIGDYRYLDYPNVNKVFDAIYNNPLMLLQQHPYIHGINCYREKFDDQSVYFLYHHIDDSEQMRAIVDVKNGCIREILYGTNLQDREKILAEIYEMNFSKYPRFVNLKLNGEKELFSKAKKILQGTLVVESNPMCKDIMKYLENLEEA